MLHASQADSQQMCRLALLVGKFSIEHGDVVNLDQTGVHLVPTGGGRTYAPTGSRDVALHGLDDKRQITGQL